MRSLACTISNQYVALWSNINQTLGADLDERLQLHIINTLNQITYARLTNLNFHPLDVVSSLAWPTTSSGWKLLIFV